MLGFETLFVIFVFIAIFTTIIKGLYTLNLKERELDLKDKEIEGRYYREKTAAAPAPAPAPAPARPALPSRLRANKSAKPVDIEKLPQRFRAQATRVMPVRDEDWSVYNEPAFIRSKKVSEETKKNKKHQSI